ncbi:uncharacterized protein EMPS_06466 [Entomortierella parvispora]|uniref:YCII-related domain-containing protein n=1 Tax=Entomortierella parvispora TaxID=205924 RepID=A0A9P3LXI0_9FUNG|nr:uncharacterized protein EMPS_06466 [Entomortierella parvispora]
MFLSAIRTPTVTRSLQAQSTRALSVSAALNEKKQFIVIAHDHTDADAQKRRLSVRETHLAGARALKKDGTLQLGGALLTNHSESGKMVGSIMIFSAESEEDVRKIIEKDQYVQGNVWAKYDIYPFRQAAFP